MYILSLQLQVGELAKFFYLLLNHVVSTWIIWIILDYLDYPPLVRNIAKTMREIKEAPKAYTAVK